MLNDINNYLKKYKCIIIIITHKENEVTYSFDATIVEHDLYYIHFKKVLEY